MAYRIGMRGDAYRHVLCFAAKQTRTLPIAGQAESVMSPFLPRSLFL